MLPAREPQWVRPPEIQGGVAVSGLASLDLYLSIFDDAAVAGCWRLDSASAGGGQILDAAACMASAPSAGEPFTESRSAQA